MSDTNASTGGWADAVKNDIHSCSYFCMRPGCVLTQRNELRDMLAYRTEQLNAALVDAQRYRSLMGKP